ncbi:MAG: 30S ribosomal protein S4 [Deltaproteobacteria bacterium]|nr:30S ribosomal protein S4 [Deltaproteobacteria bacterium]
MARYVGPACRLCRREGLKLFLKGERCYTEKCAVERRNYIPGQHGQARHGKISEYGRQLREKQKVKRIYGIQEKQFRGYYEKASSAKGVTGELLLAFLERRLDNVVYRLGFATSRAEARLLVRHGHVLLNGKACDIPSLIARAGDEVKIRDKSKEIARIVEAVEAVDRRGVPAWLTLDRKGLSGKLVTLPTRGDITMPIEERLIVELYSK